MSSIDSNTRIGTRAWAEIDLGRLRSNVSRLRDFTGVPIVAVVKADAYGHGAVACAKAALEAGCPMLAVASVEEAVVMREAGIDAPILVLGVCDEAEVDEAIAANLEVAVHGEWSLRMVTSALRRADVASLGRVLRVHLKIDTGMHRLGCAPEAAPQLAAEIWATDGVELAGLWTHLAVADEPIDPFTDAQIAAFEAAVRSIETSLGGFSGGRRPLLHAANSAGAIAHPRSRYDFVRSGIAVYGVRPAPNFPLPDDLVLEPVLAWKSRVVHVRDVEPGARPSYGRTRRVSTGKLAVVPVGYADGFLRTLSNRADVLIRGRRHRIAGTVTMDHLVVECSCPVDVGDEVVLVGEQADERVTAEELARLAGTIAYEILVRIGPRVRRVPVDSDPERSEEVSES